MSGGIDWWHHLYCAADVNADSTNDSDADQGGTEVELELKKASHHQRMLLPGAND